MEDSAAAEDQVVLPDPGVVSPELDRRLREVFVARYGWELGVEVWRDALAYAWQHRERLAGMSNPTGYLYRVGQSAARRHGRLNRRVAFPEITTDELPHVEPGLASALASLSQRQRVAVVLVYGYGWTLEAAAEAIGVSTSTLRNHLARGLASLRRELGVTDA